MTIADVLIFQFTFFWNSIFRVTLWAYNPQNNMEHAWVCMRPLRPCVLYIRLYDPNKNKIRLETLTLRRPGCGNTAPAPLCWFLPSRKFAESPRWAAAACLTSANNKITEEKDFYQGTSKGVYLFIYICIYIYYIYTYFVWKHDRPMISVSATSYCTLRVLLDKAAWVEIGFIF